MPPLLVSLRHFSEWHLGHSLRMHFETAPFCMMFAFGKHCSIANEMGNIIMRSITSYRHKAIHH